MGKQASLMKKFNKNPKDPNKQGLWREVRSLKRKFTPQYVKMKKKHGKHDPLILRAETVASYLEEEHWKNMLTDSHAGQKLLTTILLMSQLSLFQN